MLRSEPGFARPVAIREFNRPMADDEAETAQTIAMMEELADRDAPTRTVINAVNCALDEAGLTLASNPEAKARAIYWFLKRTIRYVPVPGTSPLVDQTLIPPATLLQMPDPEGDCPQFSMLASAMLRVCCVGSCFKTIAADPDFPQIYSHVYNMVEIGPGAFLPFDSSNGPAPGAEYAQSFKSRVWPQNPAPRCKEQTPMVRRGNMPAPRGGSFRNSSLRGSMGIAFLPLSGTICDDSGCYDDGSDSGAGTPGADMYPVSQTSPGATSGGIVFDSPSSGGGNPYTLATALAADATGLAAPIIKAATTQPPYYTTNPANGQTQLYNPSTGTFVGSSLTSSLSSLSPTTILIGIAVLAAFAFSGKK